MMRLKFLKIHAQGPDGWQSDGLQFADDMTQLFGPNSCGKTPIIQAIAFALGYPVKFRDDIVKNCASVELTLAGETEDITLLRQVNGRFDARISSSGTEDLDSYYSEKDYSAELFRLFKVTTTTLTSTGNEPVEPYLSTFLPLFYLDQDQGYTTIYRAPASFIKDQYAEMLRLAFGLPVKHSFERQKLRIDKNKRLNQLDRLIVSSGETIEELRKELGASPRSTGEISSELERHKESLQSLRASRTEGSDAYRALKSLIHEKKGVLTAMQRELRDLRARVSGFGKIQAEIEIEIRTLSLNNEARRLFTSFEEICANPQCGLFLASSESYGKSLLYLRDQVKDLERSRDRQNSRIVELESASETLSQEIEANEKQVGTLAEEDDVNGLIDTIRELTERVYDLQRELQRVAELEENEQAYIQLRNEREAVQNELAVLSSSSGQGDLRAMEIRAQLREGIKKWLDILDTKNVSRDVVVDADFGVLFGSEKVSQIHGSTLTRVILAVHSALFELYLSDPGRQMRFLILDTPRQQDIEAAALAKYVSELKSLAAERDAQIVFSTTEYHYETTDGDVEWTPSFPGPEQQMFLGTRAKAN